MEQYMEQSVAAETNARAKLLYGACWLAIILLLIAALAAGASVLNEDASGISIHWPGAIVAALSLALAWFLFRRKDWLILEYDYTLRDDTLEISAVLNRKRRRSLGRIEMPRVQQCGPAAHVEVERVGRLPGLKLRKWYLNQEKPLFCIQYSDGSERCAAFLELNEAMINRIKCSRGLPAGAWRNPEGR